MQESKTEVVWPRKETRPRIRRKKTLEMVPPGRRKRGRPKQIWMDCVNRDTRAIGTKKDEVHDRICWRRSVSAAAKWERLYILFSCISIDIICSVSLSYHFSYRCTAGAISFIHHLSLPLSLSPLSLPPPLPLSVSLSLSLSDYDLSPPRYILL